MASITFNLPDEHITRLVDAFCGLHNYDPETGETRPQFAQRLLREYLVSQVRRWEQLEAKRIADATVMNIDVTN